MRRLRYLAMIGAYALAACGDTSPRPKGDAAPGGDAHAATVEGVRGGTPIEITATLGGRELSASGLGECEHAAEGSIHNRPASLWTAQYAGRDQRLRRLDLTFWREQPGPESVTLALQVGDEVHRIATVQGGEMQGRGTARLEGGGEAGSFVVEGVTEGGTPLQLRVRCERFTTLVAEGG